MCRNSVEKNSENTLFFLFFGRMKKIFLVFCSIWGALLGISQGYGQSLILTEIYNQWNNEFIEILNPWPEEFFWPLEIEGVRRANAKDSSLDLGEQHIAPWEVFVVAHQSWALDPDRVPHLDILSPSLFVSASSASEIVLYSDSQALDRLQISKSLASQINTSKKSLHRVRTPSGRTLELTQESHVRHAQSPHLVHPGVVRAYLSWEYLLRDLSMMSPSDSSPSGPSPWECVAYPVDFRITEIYRWGEYADYIEFVVDQNRTGSLVFSGTLLSSRPLVLENLELQAHTHYLLTSNPETFRHTDNILVYQDLSLGKWFIDVMSTDWELLSRSLVEQGTWVYYPSSVWECTKEFEKGSAPSPWFDKQFLLYMQDSSPEDPLLCEDEPILVPELNYGLSIVEAYSEASNTWQAIRIAYSVQDTEPLDLSNFRMIINGKDNKTISGETINPGEVLTITRNFGFRKTVQDCIQFALPQQHYTIVYDTLCGKFYNDSASGGSTWSWAQDDLPWDSDTSLAVDLRIVSLDYSWPSAGTQDIVIQYVSGHNTLDLSKLKILVNGKNKPVKGTISPWETKTLTRIFNLLKTKPTCVELVLEGGRLDRYCYTPDQPEKTDDAPQEDLEDLWFVYDTLEFRIVWVDYSPPSGEKQMISIHYSSGSQDIDLAKLRMRVNGSNKLISWTIAPWETLALYKRFGMLKTKATCVELIYKDIVYDAYCYDPSKPQELILSGEVTTNNRSWLMLHRVLPNPAGRDIPWENELVALRRDGHTGQVLDRQLKLKLWSTTMQLSGIVVQAGETVFASSKAIPNWPSCIELWNWDTLQDQICYPQSPDDVRYYHPRLGIWPETIPSALINALDFQSWELSKLRLTRTPDKKVCLTYETLQIRCVWVLTSSNTLKDRALLTLNNAYIARIHQLYYAGRLWSRFFAPYLDAYQWLSQRIKSWATAKIHVRGKLLNPQSMQHYIDIVYAEKAPSYLLHELGSELLGEHRMDLYYDQVYGVLN